MRRDLDFQSYDILDRGAMHLLPERLVPRDFFDAISVYPNHEWGMNSLGELLGGLSSAVYEQPELVHGVLVVGGPGEGKSELAKAILNKLLGNIGPIANFARRIKKHHQGWYLPWGGAFSGIDYRVESDYERDLITKMSKKSELDMVVANYRKGFENIAAESMAEQNPGINVFAGDMVATTGFVHEDTMYGMTRALTLVEELVNDPSSIPNLGKVFVAVMVAYPDVLEFSDNEREQGHDNESAVPKDRIEIRKDEAEMLIRMIDKGLVPQQQDVPIVTAQDALDTIIRNPQRRMRILAEKVYPFMMIDVCHIPDNRGLMLLNTKRLDAIKRPTVRLKTPSNFGEYHPK